MSWAACRSTTRVEDKSYCLLGLFEVNMPLLYGEGERAFLRLQEEILKVTGDYTLFAWTQGQHPGLLADSPACFQDLELHDSEFGDGKVQLSCAPHLFSTRGHQWYKKFRSPSIPDEPPVLTARGLRITLPMSIEPRSNNALAYFHCQAAADGASKPLLLKLTRSTHDQDLYERNRFLAITVGDNMNIGKMVRRTIYISQRRDFAPERPIVRHKAAVTAFKFTLSGEDNKEMQFVPKRNERWPKDYIFSESNIIALLHSRGSQLFVRAGVEGNKPWCEILTHKKENGEVASELRVNRWFGENPSEPHHITAKRHPSGVGEVKVHIKSRPSVPMGNSSVLAFELQIIVL
jgi:hypothetical protein